MRVSPTRRCTCRPHSYALTPEPTHTRFRAGSRKDGTAQLSPAIAETSRPTHGTPGTARPQTRWPRHESLSRLGRVRLVRYSRARPFSELEALPVPSRCEPHG